MRAFLFITVWTALFACNAANQDQPAPDLPANEVSPTSAGLAMYCNARFGYCIDYPPTLLSAQPESENGDGRVFINNRGEKTLTVYGRLNMNAEGEPLSLDQQFKEDVDRIHAAPGNKITYQHLGKNFFVLSGYQEAEIFYQKTIIKEDAFAYAILRYPEAEKNTFTSLSEKIFTSFR